MTNNKVRLIAFYLPQYHPIPENDKWWGKGFTEWINVTKAKPLFPGHYQPHLPADLGFYDLRLPEARQAQADLAREYGIYGFCYYHYWFNGKRLLERPFNEVLESGKPNFPFCLCWANENWTRIWDGQDKYSLLEQQYSEEDDREHIQWFFKAFQDKRYIRIEDKPLFLVYRVSKLPNPLRTTSIWREEARQMGIGEIFLCRVDSFMGESTKTSPESIGFDASVEFQPDGRYVGSPLRRGWLWRLARRLGFVDRVYENNTILDYNLLVENSISTKNRTKDLYFRCVTPQWDNTARRQENAQIFQGSTPELYEKWLKAVIEEAKKSQLKDNFVFINAWNEWGEGNHLEPCQKWGRAYLEATRRALGKS